ncbi:Gp19/Gp15/Gp42 family protein [Frondihabitans sp. 762G35]|uniref:Gp19/Gp15/Gp42 family protein n=1 Tax=Frondihabitans sp. 762G35 TaxID=1446794 RepID=UPI001C2001C9|nr:Gp19/Gp15/Gp42 family protein [Frondihabitans sp. 762G35]
MTPFASSDDVAEVWGDLTLAEEAKVDAWIAQASTKLRVKARKRNVDIDHLVETDELAKLTAKDAVVNAIKRVLMNPEGYRQKASTTGPFTESGTIDTALSTGLIYISDDDLDGLLPRTSNRIRSFRVRSGLL